MITSPNMGLIEWTTDGDDFSWATLKSNWDAIDAHDHTATKGVQIPTGGIAPGAINASLLAAHAVTQAALANNSVGTAQIQAGAVGSSQIAAGAITGAVLPAGGITYGQLNTTILPLGTVAMWWRQGGSGLPGGGWEICDGRAWTGITNSMGLSTGTIPDLRGHFAIGADVTGVHGPVIGTVGAPFDAGSGSAVAGTVSLLFIMLVR